MHARVRGSGEDDESVDVASPMQGMGPWPPGGAAPNELWRPSTRSATVSIWSRDMGSFQTCVVGPEEKRWARRDIDWQRRKILIPL